MVWLQHFGKPFWLAGSSNDMNSEGVEKSCVREVVESVEHR